MAESVLQPHRTDIARLYFEERNTQAEIIRYLEQAYGFRVTPSTLSRFIKTLSETKKPPEPGEPNVSPDEEKVLQDGRVWVHLQSTLEEIIGQNALTQARLSELEDAAAERHTVIVKQMQGAEVSGQGVSHGVMVGVWKQAALWTGIGWGVLFLMVVLGWLWWSAPAPKAAGAVQDPPRREAPAVKKR